VPLASQDSGVNPLHRRVAGEHSPEHAPAVHTKLHVSILCELTRSRPHRITSFPWHESAPLATLAQAGTMGAHVPCV
jgi:hypothetical protein